MRLCAGLFALALFGHATGISIQRMGDPPPILAVNETENSWASQTAPEPVPNHHTLIQPTTAFGYISYISDKTQLSGVELLGNSLRSTGTPFDLILLYSPLLDGDYLRARLNTTSWRVTELGDLPNPFPTEEFSSLQWAKSGFSFLRAWQLPYTRLLFVSPKMKVMSNIDAILTRPSQSAFSAPLDCTEQSKVSTNVFSFTPNAFLFDELLDHAQHITHQAARISDFIKTEFTPRSLPLEREMSCEKDCFATQNAGARIDLGACKILYTPLTCNDKEIAL